jgi:hypothetical protein
MLRHYRLKYSLPHAPPGLALSIRPDTHTKQLPTQARMARLRYPDALIIKLMAFHFRSQWLFTEIA